MKRCSAKRTNNKHIKAYSLLGKAVLHCKADPVYRAWLMLRNVKPHGYQWHTQAEVITIFATYGLSRSRWYALLGDSHFSTFFDFDEVNNRLFLRGLRRVCMDLGTLPGTAIWMESKAFHRLKSFRAAVYASQFSDKAKRISRNTIAEETGVSRSTQRRYEHAEGVEVTQNYVYTPINACDGLPIPDSMAEARGWSFPRTVNGKVVLVWQNVNTYTNQNERARRGMARKVSRIIRSTLLCAESQRRTGYFVDSRDKWHRSVPIIRGKKALRERCFSDLHPVKPRGHCLNGDLWEHIEAIA